MRRFWLLAVLGLLVFTFAAIGPVRAQTDEPEAETSLVPTDDDREAVEVMLSKLNPDEKQLVASLLLQMQDYQAMIEDLRKELATLKLFYTIVVKERDKLRAELAKYVGLEEPARAQITVIRGDVTSVESIARLIMVEFKADRNIPVGAELGVLRKGERIGRCKVVLSEGSAIVAELVVPENATPPVVIAGDQVEYVVEAK